LVYTQGAYKTTATDTKGTPVNDTGKYVVVFRKQADGSWKVAEPIMTAIKELWAVSGSDTVDLLMSRAAQFANAAEIDLSLAILDAVVDIAPNEAEVWYLRAKVNVLQGKPERALTDLRRALELDAKHYRAITDLGLVLEQLGAKKEALDAYRRALAVNPFLEDAQSGVDALKREVEGQDI
jgi:Flp pilus assembly protein TadD